MKNIALTLASLSLALAHAPQALAQTHCSSDGAPKPVALFERFISADCAAATTDALPRLQALGRKHPTFTDVHVSPVDADARGRLRVAHGVAFNDYVGVGINFAPSAAKPQRKVAAAPFAFHLLLVEAIPAGTDGTVVPRHVVRNAFEGEWLPAQQQARTPGKPWAWMETRSMRIPEGARAERLHLVGWVQDASGQIVAAAQSVCR